MDPVKIKVKHETNANKFRQAALYFQENGYYVSAPEGTTEWRNYWIEEARRCLNGFTADDGGWISGYYYFYLNYCPINRVIRTEKKHPKTGKLIVNIRKDNDFPDFYDYDRAYFDMIDKARNVGRHLAVIKKRRAGYSFKNASMLCRNFYLIPGSKSYAIASEAEFLLKDGVLTKAWDYMDFLDEHTAWAKKRQKADTKMHKRASYIVDLNGVKTEMGFKSEIIGITLKNDPHKIRGKAGMLYLFEEGGQFPNLKESWQITLPSVRQDSEVFGQMIAFGTGGSKESNFEGLKDLFYEPDPYECLPIENVWDEGKQGTKAGFFVPEYMNMSGPKEEPFLFMDENGNSKIDVAIGRIEDERERVIQGASDRNAIDRYIAEHPVTPEEACLSVSGNIFPKKDLIRHLASIRNNPTLENYKQVGELYFDDNGNIRWDHINTKVSEIKSYRLSDGAKKDGAIVIWEHPVNDPPYGLYIAGCLTPGEKVLTDKGLKSIEKVDHKDKLINKEGEAVDIKVFQKRWKEDHDTYRFKMSNTYRTTNFTRGHPLYISKTGYNINKTINESKFNFDFIRADKVEEGDWTKWPNVYKSNNSIDVMDYIKWNKYKTKGNKIDNPLLKKDFWWFVGLWLGDGCCYNNRIELAFNKDDQYYSDKVISIVNTIFKRKPQYQDLDYNGSKITINSVQLCKFLEDNFGKYSYGKFIPEWVKRLPDVLKKELLLGYLASDGCITTHTKGYLSTEFVSVSLRLLEDVQDTLFSLGIISGLSKMRDSIESHIQGRKVHQRDTYHLRLSHHSTLDFVKLSDDTEDIKIKKVDLKVLPKIRKRPKDGCFISEDGKYVYFQIKKIEHSLYTGTVYNFECDTHNYISHHISQKNCDPYDHDKSLTNSLGACIIYKRFQDFESYYDLPVAEYTGRPDTAEEYYENVRKLLIYYKANLLYENEKKGLFTYFSHKHSEYLLADQPDIIKDIIKDSKVQRGKGIHMNKPIKDWGEGLIKEWLTDEYAPGKMNLTKILSEPLLEELISYNDEGNFDRCLVSGTKISTPFGFENVEDIKEGSEVFTHKGNIRKVIKLDKHLSDRKILKFNVIGNYEPLVVTDNHPIYVASTNKIKHSNRIKALDNIDFVEASKLNKKYQFVLQPKRKGLKELFDNEIMYLLGWYVSDGYVNQKSNKIEIVFQRDQEEIAKKLASIIDRRLVGEYTKYNNRVYTPNPTRLEYKDGYIKLHRTSKSLSEFLVEHGGCACNKKFSKEVYNSSNTLMLAVGYLEGDGHQKKFASYDGYKREIIEASGIYEELIKQIRQILIDNGIWSSIRFIPKRNEKCQDQYGISISRKYINKIAKNSIKFKEVEEINIIEKNYQYETEEGFWTPIKFIEEVEYDDYVYNFEVEEDHSYIASNVAVHNCMAYMMVMIYREQLHHVHVKQRKDETNKSKVLFPEGIFKNVIKYG